jgi:hypothetical protein
MTLRNQIRDRDASFDDPIYGVNLRDSEESIQPGESRIMQNCEYYGRTRIRRGSNAIHAAPLGAYKIYGGTKFYFGGANPQSKRLVAYGNFISQITDAGNVVGIDSSQTAGQSTFFQTWSITDSCYISNGSNTLKKYTGSGIVNPVIGTNIPVARTGVVPILDRLMCITVNGIERTNPRVDNVWSSNSSWATLRPQLPGLFTALYPYTLRGTDTLYPGLIACQERAYYIITGKNFGSNVIDAVASDGEDASIQLLDPTVGTASPYSMCTVPGVGIFWFTSDLNVYWIQEGSLVGRYVGDKIQSTIAATVGIESTSIANLKDVWMVYFDHMLMLGIPVDGDGPYSSTQFWLDTRMLRNKEKIVWYGPMTGQTISRVWVENQQGDNKLMGGEGRPTGGGWVYQLRVPGVFTDATGVGVLVPPEQIPIDMIYQTPSKDLGTPFKEKYIQAINLEMNEEGGTFSLLDLVGSDPDRTLINGISIEEIEHPMYEAFVDLVAPLTRRVACRISQSFGDCEINHIQMVVKSKRSKPEGV